MKEPVIDKNSMVYLVLKSEKPVDGMKKLNEEVKYTCEYLIRFVARLRPPSEEVAHLLLCRLFAALSHHTVRVMTTEGNPITARMGATAGPVRYAKGTLIPPNRNWTEMRTGTAAKITEFAKNFYRMLLTYENLV